MNNTINIMDEYEFNQEAHIPVTDYTVDERGEAFRNMQISSNIGTINYRNVLVPNYYSPNYRRLPRLTSNLRAQRRLMHRRNLELLGLPIGLRYVNRTFPTGIVDSIFSMLDVDRDEFEELDIERRNYPVLAESIANRGVEVEIPEGLHRTRYLPRGWRHRQNRFNQWHYRYR